MKFSTILGITLGALLAYVVTKGMHPEFTLQTWLASLGR
jgi:hypothetical protein